MGRLIWQLVLTTIGIVLAIFGFEVFLCIVTKKAFDFRWKIVWWFIMVGWASVFVYHWWNVTAPNK